MKTSSKQSDRPQRNATLWLCMAVFLPPLFAADSCKMGNKQTGSVTAGPTGPAEVEVVTVERKDLAYTIEVPGTVEGIESASLYSKIGGFLDEIYVDIGDRVEEGKVLASLDVPELAKQRLQKQAAIASASAKVRQADAAIKQAEAEVKSSQAAVDESKTQRAEKEAELTLHMAEFKRLKNLVDNDVLEEKILDEVQSRIDIAAAGIKSTEARERTADAELLAKQSLVKQSEVAKEALEADVLVAEADLAQVETMQQYTKIVAPFSGLIVKRNVDPGAFIQSAEGNSAAEPLLVLTRIDSVRIKLDVPMAEVRWLDKKDTAVFDRIEALPDRVFRGKVTRFASALNTTSRMMRVEIELTNDEDNSLKPGFYGYVTLTLMEFPQSLTVPSSALLKNDEGESFVYVVENGKCRPKVVEIVYQDEEDAGIKMGLSEDDQVVATGGGRLADDDEVTIASTDPETE
ncbi:MAG: efflux RND transporter periplasmic adaptor subunit [Pirellulaceae bacterium]